MTGLAKELPESIPRPCALPNNQLKNVGNGFASMPGTAQGFRALLIIRQLCSPSVPRSEITSVALLVSSPHCNIYYKASQHINSALST